jgi:LPS export ABC transporter permease LptG
MPEEKLPNASAFPEPPKRRFGFLPILDFYVLREFLIPLAALIMAFMILFVIADMFNDLGEFLEAHASFAVTFQYFLLKTPGNIRFILPISVLLACMYTMANFGRCREVTAMRASGISLLRCGGSIYFSALIVTMVIFWFNEALVPYTEREADIVYHRLDNPNYATEMKMLQYRSSDKLRDWLFRSFDANGVQRDVILKSYVKGEDGKKLMAWDIHAETAKFVPDSGWQFTDVTRTPYSNRFSIAGSSEELPSLTVPISEIPETPEQIMNAVKPPEDLPSLAIIDILTSNKDMAPSLRNIYETILYFRLAFPWACFLGVFLGLPLAAKNERGGIFLSIAIAVGVVVGFQMLTQIFLVLGKQGIVPPIVGGLAPTAAFMVYGWFFVIRRSG